MYRMERMPDCNSLFEKEGATVRVCGVEKFFPLHTTGCKKLVLLEAAGVSAPAARADRGATGAFHRTPKSRTIFSLIEERT